MGIRSGAKRMRYSIPSRYHSLATHWTKWVNKTNILILDLLAFLYGISYVVLQSMYILHWVKICSSSNNHRRRTVKSILYEMGILICSSYSVNMCIRSYDSIRLSKHLVCSCNGGWFVHEDHIWSMAFYIAYYVNICLKCITLWQPSWILN